MEDNSLDKFFSKKDKKKKSKAKSGVTSADLEAGVGTKDKKKKKNQGKAENQNVPNPGDEKREEGAIPQDEEWIDYEEEKAADLTGLRIQNLQIAGKREEEESKEDQEEEGEEGEDAEKVERREAASGPWNKATAVTPAAQPVPEPMPEPKPEEPKSTGKYVPPSLRAGGSASTKAILARRKKTAPDVTSVEDFPTLGNQSYTPVRPAAGSSYSQDNDGTSHIFQRKGPELSLENKFSALQD